MKTRMFLVFALLATLSLFSQTFISAKAGLVNYQEGVTASSPHQLQEGEVFSSAARSELLMMPGTYLRLEHGAEIQMGSTQLQHPSFELRAGLAAVEINEVAKDSALAISWREFSGVNALIVNQKGLYRFEVSNEGDALKVMVQNGHLRIPGSNNTLASGQETVLGTPGHAASFGRFNAKARDDFDIWSSNRSGALSAASYKTASSMTSYYPSSSVWAFNPYGGFYTYLPYGRVVTNPYGWGYYWPGNVWDYYPVYYSGAGYLYGGGNSGVRANIASSSATPQHPTPRVPPQSPTVNGNNSASSSMSGFDAGSRGGGGGNFGGSVAASPSVSVSAPSSPAPGSSGGRRN